MLVRVLVEFVLFASVLSFLTSCCCITSVNWIAALINWSFSLLLSKIFIHILELMYKMWKLSFLQFFFINNLFYLRKIIRFIWKLEHSRTFNIHDNAMAYVYKNFIVMNFVYICKCFIILLYKLFYNYFCCFLNCFKLVT